MNNAPALVFRGAALGCVLICILTALISASQGNGQSTALAAALPAASTEVPQPAVDQAATKKSERAKSAEDNSAAKQETVKSETKENSKKNKAQKTDCSLAASYPQNILQWCGLIEQAAKQYGLPANLIAALIWQESGGDAQAYSKSGAVGLMQVMPRDGLAANFQCANGPCFASRPTIQELRDPAFNIDYGTRFLAGLLARRGSLREALYAYGPMGMGYAYADKVLGIYAAHAGN